MPGLFSNRIHVFDVTPRGRKMRLRAVSDDLVDQSGCISPQIGAGPGTVQVTMIGAATGNTAAGGIVELDDRMGAFTGWSRPDRRRSRPKHVPGP